MQFEYLRFGRECFFVKITHSYYKDLKGTGVPDKMGNRIRMNKT
jgi:hypothetical protein